MRALIRIGDGADACWEWTGKKTPRGYGCKQFNGRTLLAHRWVFQLFKGWIPKEFVINHLCRNRACVNPKHLEITNTAGNCRHGAVAKLNVEQVAQIKRLLMTARHGDIQQIANRFGISRQAITSIRYGRAWRDVQPAKEAA